jgi:EAL domain-containing protein (putative c-di-GMP-specific phosphodiesterase class I)/CheY-like chemotaxis protein
MIKNDRSNAPATILLADDEPAVARSHARLLTDAGYTVVTVGGGLEAIRHLTAARFDVVLSDIQMPGMDGIELLREIRRRDLDVPIVFLTGSPAIETVAGAMEYGAFRYLVKPIAREKLLAVIERAVTMHRFALVRREAREAVTSKALGDRAGLEACFDVAVERMWIAMQPVVSWRSQSTFAYEALLRTDEPTLADPIDFVDAAERLGRTHALGRLVRAAIARELAGAPATTKVFVNIHPSDLEDDELSSRSGALTPYASRVVLEVTERATLDDVNGLSARVARLRTIGFRLALDDLGAGYAGLASFARLEPEIVKVDMSLVRRIDASPLKQKLFSSFTSLCHDLNIDIIAEGVESLNERVCLSDLGGDLFQGFLFAPPARGFPEPRF